MRKAAENVFQEPRKGLEKTRKDSGKRPRKESGEILEKPRKSCGGAPSSENTRGFKAALIPNPAEWPCPRCTRRHPHAGVEECRSLGKMCRRCGKVGHSTEVHDVTDPHYRQLIVNTLGINLWDDLQGEEAPSAPERLQPAGVNILSNSSDSIPLLNPSLLRQNNRYHNW